MRPIGSILPGAIIAHDRLGSKLGSARRVTNSQLVCVSGGFKLLKAGMSVLQALTQPKEHLFPYPGVSNHLDAACRDIFPRARLASG